MTFITATEAKEIVLSSAAEVDRLMPILDKAIRAAAEDGHRKLLCYREVPWESAEDYMPVATSKLQERLIERLCALGFFACVVSDHSYIPPGLQDSDGNGPVHTNRVLKVSW
jgi:hypothetical protein